MNILLISRSESTTMGIQKLGSNCWDHQFWPLVNARAPLYLAQFMDLKLHFWLNWGGWDSCPLIDRFRDSSNMSQVFEKHFILGLNQWQNNGMMIHCLLHVMQLWNPFHTIHPLTSCKASTNYYIIFKIIKLYIYIYI